MAIEEAKFLSAKPKQVVRRTGDGWLEKEAGQITITGFANADEQRPTRPMAREVNPDPPDAGWAHGALCDFDQAFV